MLQHLEVCQVRRTNKSTRSITEGDGKTAYVGEAFSFDQNCSCLHKWAISIQSNKH